MDARSRAEAAGLPARAPARLPARPVVAVVGATGLVGRRLLEVLEERRFPARELRAFASDRGEARRIPFAGREVPVEPVGPGAFDGADLVFFAATGALSRELGPAAVAAGAVAIDKSSTWRLDPLVPLVVPEINAAALAGHRGLVASPNCTTIGIAMALEPLRRAAGLARVVVTTLQAASGAGEPGLRELERQQADPAAPAAVFPRPLARNVVPLCGERLADGSSDEEQKLSAETRRILALPALEVAATCVRVPVAVGHAATLLVETRAPLSPADARAALAAFPGVRLVADDEPLPTPLDVAGSDQVLVGRVRAAPGGGLLLWQVADNLRKGAATNAVQIAERLF